MDAERGRPARRYRRWIVAGMVGGIATIAVIAIGGAMAASSMRERSNAPGPEAPSVATMPQNGLPGIVVPKPAHMPGNKREAALVRRGRYLATAGDCAACHTVPGGKPFAGGQAIATPFGAIYAPNITPDRKYGIGAWSDKQFWRLMHDGVAPGSSLVVFPKYVYPVMPYTAYAHLSYHDVMAIKAYLDSLNPVAEPDRGNRLHFPFNLRAGLMVWQMLFFHPHKMHYDKGWSKAERNGAFLVTALEHCSACHTPRNMLMASETANHYLAGGHIIGQSWYAPNISASKSHGVGGWSKQQLVAYLTGGDMTHGVAFGPMQSVVFDSLDRLPKKDVSDIATYLLRATKPTTHRPPPGLKSAERAASIGHGRAIYATDCAHCHGNNGNGVNGNIPNLAHNDAVASGAPDDAISMVLGGFTPWHDTQSPMPGFRTRLSAQQVADVVNFVRTSWGNRGKADATAAEVGTLAATAHDKVELDSANSQVGLTRSDGGRLGHYRRVSGALDMSSDLDTCMLQTKFAEGANGAPPMHYAGSCIDNGTRLRGDLTLNGRTRAVDMTIQDRYRDHRLVGMSLHATIHAVNWGLPATKGPTLTIADNIAVVTPLE